MRKTNEEIRTWLEKLRKFLMFFLYTPIRVKEDLLFETHSTDFEMIDAILSALEPPKLDVSWMKLAEELNIPFSAVKIIRDKIEKESALDGLGMTEKEAISLIGHFDRWSCMHQEDKPDCPQCQRIKSIILGHAAKEGEK